MSMFTATRLPSYIANRDPEKTGAFEPACDLAGIHCETSVSTCNAAEPEF